MSDLPTCLAAALDDHERQRQRLLSHTEDAWAAETCKAETGVGSLVAVFAHGVTYYLSVAPDQSYEEAVAPVLRWLRQRGYKHTGKPVVVSDHVLNVHFTHAARQSRLCLYVSVPTDDGAVCRMVKTGEVATPVYELQCAK